MNFLLGWSTAFRIVGQYLLYRLGLAKLPSAEDKFEGVQQLIGQFVGWNRYMRVRHPERCPTDHPTVFYGNHVKLDDPFYHFRAAYLATDGKVTLRAMHRDDFFSGWLFNNRLLDMNELLACLGTFGIDRDRPSMAQLKLFLKLLEVGDSFIMFPGRTRTCSGLLMDYRGQFQEPGSISFFLHQTQRRHPEVIVSAVPCYRNFNPRTKHSSCNIGEEQFLEKDASREIQREFDLHLVEVMSPLVEVNATHLTGALLFLHVVHGNSGPIPLVQLQEQVTAVAAENPHPYWDIEDAEDWPKAVRGSLKIFEKAGCLAVRGTQIEPNRDRILDISELTTKFRKTNPVRFYANQILHVTAVIELLEAAALSTLNQS